jgi:hypothetical protein
MFFLIRLAFWLGVVCVLLPGTKSAADLDIDPATAVTAAGAAVSDMAGFCERQPGACVVGGKVAVAIGQKAEAGARTIYEMINAKLAEPDSPKADEPKKDEPKAATKGAAAKVAPAARGTLTSNDLAPAWHAPVPLPPRREARINGPAA